MHFDDYFKQRRDATGKQGFATYVKTTVGLRMLAYRYLINANEDYLKMAETTSLNATNNFCGAVITVYEEEFSTT